jgi:hypothetical protein
VGAVLLAGGDRHVELAGKVGVLLFADEDAGELPDHRRRVKKLVRREPRDRATDHIADVVHAGLQRD